MKKKILVTGSGGMVGSYLGEVFSDFDLFLTDIARGYIGLDVRDIKKTKKIIKEIKPHIIFHMAAATDVDRCDKDKKWAYDCNREGTKNVALAAKEEGSFMFYISSGSVFSGKRNEPAKETDRPDPINTYGLSKLAGEKEVENLVKKYCIIRTGWMMGGGPEKDKKFVGKIMKKITSGEETLYVTNDRFGSPIYARDLLIGIKKLLNLGKTGFYHMVNEGTCGCSRYDIAQEIKNIMKFKNLEIKPISTRDFKLYAERSLSEELDNYRLKEEGMDLMRPWKTALLEYLNKEWIDL